MNLILETLDGLKVHHNSEEVEDHSHCLMRPVIPPPPVPEDKSKARMVEYRKYENTGIRINGILLFKEVRGSF